MTAKELREKMLKSGAQPLGDRVFVARERRITKVGNIILPQTAQTNQAYGVVILVGDELSKPEIKPFMATFCPTYGGVVMKQRVKLPDGSKETYLVEALHTKDIYMVWPGDENVELEQEMAPITQAGGY